MRRLEQWILRGGSPGPTERVQWAKYRFTGQSPGGESARLHFMNNMFCR